MNCCHCGVTEQQFDRRRAQRDLTRFRRRGPDPITLTLLNAIASRVPPDRPTLLDIGGGIGGIHHRLLESGVASAVQVDASSAYLEAAAMEASRLGHVDRVQFRHGDIRAVGPGLPQADLVTLDRVVCCDPDFEGLLATAAAHTRKLLGLSFPRRRWYIRLAISVSNRWRKLRGHPFRVYLHPPEALATTLERSGLRRCWRGGTVIWAAELFERADQAEVA
jgi:magnesium-protoporphyrin O-methyltransferase